MTKAEKVLLKINNGWADNWDMIIDTFGEEIAKELDEACLDAYNKKQRYELAEKRWNNFKK